MNKRSKISALLGAGVLGAGLLALGLAAPVFADGQVNWEGNGVTNGELNQVQCDSSNTGYLLWVFTTGGDDSVTSATLHLGGTGSGDYAMTDDNGQWKATTPFFELDGLSANVTFVGSLGSGNAVLTISHGCPGETASEAPSFEQSQEAATDTPNPTEEESEAPSFSQENEGDTEAPSLPNTSTLGSNGSGPSDSAWLLIAAVGVVLASVVVLTPARAKTRR